MRSGILESLFNPYSAFGAALAARYDLSDPLGSTTTTANFTGTGTATSTLITTAFVGVGTAFLSELAAGDSVYNNSAVLIGVILSVTDNTNAVLVANGAAAITGAAFQIRKANPRIILIKDKSGNSEVNGLALNAVIGNYASAPDAAALRVTGDMDLRAQLSTPTWANGSATWYPIAKFVGSFAYVLGITATGLVTLGISTTGADVVNTNSTAAVPFSNYSTGWIRATRAQTGGLVNFYTSTDGVNWTLLGTGNQVASSGTAIFAGTSTLFLGAFGAGTAPLLGSLYRAQIYNGIAGTLVFDANFSAVAKLAASFVESSTNAATVTIATTGDYGARICGARDLVQMTAGKQATLGNAGTPSANALFDGVNDYMGSAQFRLIQPETVYMVATGIATAGGATSFFDGNGVTNTTLVYFASPTLRINSGTGLSGGTLAVGTAAIISVIFNGVLSALRINKISSVMGNAGTNNMNGFIVGALGNAGTPAQFSNIRANEILIFSAAHDSSTQDRVIRFLARKWNIAV